MNLQVKVCLLINFLSFTGCASSHSKSEDSSTLYEVRAPQTKSCLDPNAVAAMLPNVESLVDASDPDIRGETTLSQDNCDKKVYLRKKHRIIIYRDPTALEASLNSIVSTNEQDSAFTPDCLAKAERDISLLDVDLAAAIVAESRKKNAWKWNDMDIGPVRWLSCKSDKVDYYKSLDTFVHESTHGARQENCLYVASAKTHFCLDLHKDLPSRNLAAYKNFPFTNPAEIQGYKGLEAAYFGSSEQTPAMLFDELNAYTAGTAFYAGILDSIGRSAIYRDGDKRTTILLPAFMTYSLRYLNRVRREHPTLYVQNFDVNSKNRSFIIQLLDNAEKSDASWIRAAQKVGDRAKDSESWFRKEYQAERAQLGW
ncbi:MAG: hypothetical protein EOP07_01480 [Proteobacteria bacterium]|nr:MAG: hypothetical protein EOP07_01480 [Pseudomonadota bacterium]